MIAQAANTLQLFTFIQADLNTYRPKPESGFGVAEATASFDPIGSAEPRFPKSLYLIRPLFFSHELNPVALTAQTSVPVPEGLDLDAWIVQPPKDVVDNGIADADKSTERKLKRKKGKGKEQNGVKLKSGKERWKDDSNDVVLTPEEPIFLDAETAEDKAERERVRL